MMKNWKNFPCLMASVAAVYLSSTHYVMARSDSILTVVPSTVPEATATAETSIDNITVDENAASVSATPIDLTNIAQDDDQPESNAVSQTDAADNDSGVDLTEATASESTSQDESASTETAVQTSSISLSQKDPSSIRLTSVGIDRAGFDGLDELMWQGSHAGDIVKLQKALVDAALPFAFEAGLHHLNTARVLPPADFVDFGQEIISLRLEALSDKGMSGDLAIMVEQLPDQDDWKKWQEWLAIHYLLTRQDGQACAMSNEKVTETLEPLWHRINSFCAIVDGDIDRASFALDILRDSGLSDPSFDMLMDQLTGRGKVQDLDQNTVSDLDLVLMDSARITIEPSALVNLDSGYQNSVISLRYLSDDALRSLSAMRFGHDDVDTLKTSWALLPIKNISSAEALTRFSLGGDDDVIAMARLDAWQAIAAEKDDKTAAQLAIEALNIDYQYAGITGLGLWLPIIERGSGDLEIDAKIGPILGFAQETPRLLMNNKALAWHDLLAFSRKPVSVDTLTETDGFDALPLLTSIGIRIEDINWLDVKDGALPLTQVHSNLAFVDLMRLDSIADQGKKAETLLVAAEMLNGVNLSTLNRNDAAQITGALHRVGLVDTARALAREILVSWGMARHISQSTEPAAAS